VGLVWLVWLEWMVHWVGVAASPGVAPRHGVALRAHRRAGSWVHYAQTVRLRARRVGPYTNHLIEPALTHSATRTFWPSTWSPPSRRENHYRNFKGLRCTRPHRRELVSVQEAFHHDVAIARERLRELRVVGSGAAPAANPGRLHLFSLASELLAGWV
jgi:hypothetical protein